MPVKNNYYIKFLSVIFLSLLVYAISYSILQTLKIETTILLLYHKDLLWMYDMMLANMCIASIVLFGCGIWMWIQEEVSEHRFWQEEE